MRNWLKAYIWYYLLFKAPRRPSNDNKPYKPPLIKRPHKTPLSLFK